MGVYVTKAQEDLIPQIATMRQDGVSRTKICEKLSITRSQLQALLQGTYTVKELAERKRGGNLTSQAKTTPEAVGQLRAEYATGSVSKKDLAAKYHLSVAAIDSILKNKTWFDPEYKTPDFIQIRADQERARLAARLAKKAAEAEGASDDESTELTIDGYAQSDEDIDLDVDDLDEGDFDDEDDEA